MRAARIFRTGGPEVIEIVDVDTPAPRPGQILVRNQTIGVNFIDTYHRSGLYPVKLPSGLGTEGAGLVEALGEGVVDLAPGDVVAYAGGPLGAYAEYNAIPAARTVKIPAGMTADLAAAALVKGLTAECLLRRVYPVRAGEVVLVQAGAGGVGSILVQWAKHLGATVIATAGSDEKAERVRTLGADHVIRYRHEDVAAEVKRATGGVGVSVVYDAVGASTYEGSLGSLAHRGMFVSFGSASGPAPAIDPLSLMRGGSLFFTRPTMFDYTASRAELDQAPRRYSMSSRRARSGSMSARLLRLRTRVALMKRWKRASRLDRRCSSHKRCVLCSHAAGGLGLALTGSTARRPPSTTISAPVQ